MHRSGFLSEEDRKALTALARDGSSPCQVTRRANALVLLNEGWSCQQAARALLLGDDTIRGWRKLFEQRGIEGLASFDVGEVSADARAAGRMVLARSYAERIAVLLEGEVVAVHPRQFRRGQIIYDPWHYLPVLRKKPGALRNGAPLSDVEGQGLGPAAGPDPDTREAEATRRRRSSVRQGVGRSARSRVGRGRGRLRRSAGGRLPAAM